jgi:hypothetical protein
MMFCKSECCQFLLWKNKTLSRWPSGCASDIGLGIGIGLTKYPLRASRRGAGLRDVSDRACAQAAEGWSRVQAVMKSVASATAEQRKGLGATHCRRPIF